MVGAEENLSILRALKRLFQHFFCSILYVKRTAFFQETEYILKKKRTLFILILYLHHMLPLPAPLA